MILFVAQKRASKKLILDSVENSVRDCYKNKSIKGYYDLQAAEVDGAYNNVKRHILIFGTQNKA